jgi:hypothetical protein
MHPRALLVATTRGSVQLPSFFKNVKSVELELAPIALFTKVALITLEAFRL